MKIMDDPLVIVKNGKLRGKICTDYGGRSYYSFQGIPYAKPPLGSLRFKAPLRPDSWSGVRDATQNGEDCLSNNPFESNGSEDSLFLNVYTSELHETLRAKPVMFWIHGGGFTTGSGSSLVYGPQFLMTKDVVVVTINYRLGLLGFLKLEDPSLEVYGNAGLKDQVMALRWVQENIRQFCGDPNNVTVFGESAGAASIHYLILSPSAKGLFHKAILQSGNAFCGWAWGRPLFSLIRKALNLTETTEKELLGILQDMSPNELLELQKKMPDDFEACFLRSMGPVIENESSPNPIVNQRPEDAIASGNYNHVPMIIGYNSKEGMIADVHNGEFKRFGHAIKDFEKKIPYNMNFTRKTDLSRTVADKIKHFYYGRENPSELNSNQYYTVHTDNAFLWPLSMTISCHMATSKQPIYLYRLSVDSNLNVCKIMSAIDSPGVAHADDIGYLFKSVITPKIIPNSVEDLSVRRMVALWTNFAKNGNPNSVKKDPLLNVHWKTVENDLNYLDIGENLTVGINPDHHRVEFWKSIFSISRQKCKL